MGVWEWRRPTQNSHCVLITRPIYRSIDLSNRNLRLENSDAVVVDRICTWNVCDSIRFKILLRSKNAARSLKRIGNLFTTMTTSAKETLKTKVAIVGSGACAEFDRRRGQTLTVVSSRLVSSLLV